jgi:hypothetical protein
MSPRPILKRTSNVDNPSHRHHGVHFPPSTSLTRTFVADSYDRTPIVVTPNSCALPERGCPGRTYSLDESARCPSRRMMNASQISRDYHPRVLNLLHQNGHYSDVHKVGSSDHAAVPTLLPPLIQDLSSESDESDASVPVFTDFPFAHFYHDSAAHGPKIPDTSLSISNLSVSHGYSYTSSTLSVSVVNGPMSFLPHPPSPPSRHTPPSIEEEPVHHPRPSRRRPRNRSRDLDRMRVEDDCNYDSDAPSFSKEYSSSKSVGKRLSSLSFQDQDSGCLDGF